MRQSTKYFILLYGAFETFVFTGNIFGWSSLLYMLRQEGIYDHVCVKPSGHGEANAAAFSVPGILVTSVVGDLKGEVMGSTDFGNVSVFSEYWSRNRTNPPVTCAEQDRILNLAYTIGSFCIGISAFIWGFLLDKWGLRIVRLVINGFITLGCILLSLTINKTSFLLFPSLILMCLAGVPLRLANMQIADLFPNQRSTIITTYSGAFTASASVFVFIKYGFDAGLPWEWACFLLVCLSVLMLPVTLFVLPADRIREPGESGSLFTPAANEVHSIAPTVWGSFSFIPDTPVFKKKSDTSTNSTAEVKFTESVSKGEKSDSKQGKSQTKEEKIGSREEKSKSKVASKIDRNTEKELPLTMSLFTFSFCMHQYWFCWLLLYTIIYVGTLHLWIERSSVHLDEASWFSEVFGLCQVTGLFLAPISGIFMDWNIRRTASQESDPEVRKLRVLRSCFWPMFLTTLMEAAAQVCKFYNLKVAIYVSIVAVTLLRAFFISIGTAYLRIRYPAYHFNKMLGIMSTTSALVTLLQFPLFIWESSSTQGALHVNIFEAACLVVAFIHPLLLLVTPFQEFLFKKEKEARDKFLEGN